MGVHDPCRNLDKFADMRDKKNPFHAHIYCHVDRLTYIVAAFDVFFERKLHVLPQIIGSVVSRCHKHVLLTHCCMLCHFHPDTVDQSFLTHRLYDTGCSKNRYSAHDSQTGIEGLSGYLLPFRHRDRHFESALIVILICNFFDCL